MDSFLRPINNSASEALSFLPLPNTTQIKEVVLENKLIFPVVASAVVVTLLALGCIGCYKLKAMAEEIEQSVNNLVDATVTKLNVDVGIIATSTVALVKDIQLNAKTLETQNQLVNVVTILALVTAAIAIITFAMIPFFPLINFAAICLTACVLTGCLIPACFLLNSEKCFDLIKLIKSSNNS